MLTIIVAAAVAASSPTIASPHPDPAKDQVTVCTAMVAEKMYAIMNGDVPTSMAVPLYTDNAKLSDKDAEAFQRGCDMFEQGFVLALQIQSVSPSAAASMDNDTGEFAPDHSNDPVDLQR